MAVLTNRIEIRLTDEEKRMLEELAKRRYPEFQRAQAVVIRRLIREAWAKEQKG